MINIYVSKNTNIKRKVKFVARLIFMILLAIEFHEQNENLMVINKF
jgi:hypothetical protein